MLSKTSGVLLASLCAAAAPAQVFRPAPRLSTTFTPGNGFFRFDLDANGRSDAVILDGFSGAAVLMNPDLAAQGPDPVSVYSAFSGFLLAIYAEDMNNDGLLDLVLEEGGVFSFGRLFYLAGDGAGNFGAPVDVAVSADKVIYTAVGDFNGDGLADAAHAEFPFGGTPNLQIRTQAAMGFQLIHTETIVGTFGEMAAGDFNGDGFDDLAWWGGGTLRILPGGAQGVGAVQQVSVQPEMDDGFVADLDDDGLDDLVLQEISFSGWRVDALFGDAAAWLPTTVPVVPAGNPARCDFLGPFDVDGDGDEDLLALLRNTGGYTVIRNDGRRGFSPQPYLTDMTGGLIDLDGDGDLDELIPQFFSSGYERRENLSRYGQPCAGAMGDPWLEMGAAIPGATLEVEIQGAAPSSLAQLFLSDGATVGACGPQLDFGLMIYPAANAPLFVSLTDAAGSLSYALPIPTGAPAGPYFMQGVILDGQGAYNLIGYQLAATGGRGVLVY